MDFDNSSFGASILPELSSKLPGKSINESQKENIINGPNHIENKTNDQKTKFPPLIWSSAIYNILVSLGFLWWFATQYNSINETFSNALTPFPMSRQYITILLYIRKGTFLDKTLKLLYN